VTFASDRDNHESLPVVTIYRKDGAVVEQAIFADGFGG
jgi:hypothetical protein